MVNSYDIQESWFDLIIDMNQEERNGFFKNCGFFDLGLEVAWLEWPNGRLYLTDTKNTKLGEVEGSLKGKPERLCFCSSKEKYTFDEYGIILDDVGTIHAVVKEEENYIYEMQRLNLGRKMKGTYYRDDFFKNRVVGVHDYYNDRIEETEKMAEKHIQELICEFVRDHLP